MIAKYFSFPCLKNKKKWSGYFTSKYNAVFFSLIILIFARTVQWRYSMATKNLPNFLGKKSFFSNELMFWQNCQKEWFFTIGIFKIWKTKFEGKLLLLEDWWFQNSLTKLRSLVLHERGVTSIKIYNQEIKLEISVVLFRSISPSLMPSCYQSNQKVLTKKVNILHLHLTCFINSNEWDVQSI